MGNMKGQAYGLTILSPIKDEPKRQPSHIAEIRNYLAELGTGANSPLANVPKTHIARFAVIGDVYYQDHPSDEDHLKSQYLLWCANFDGALDDYLDQLAANIPDEVEAIWKHCVAYPGTGDRAAFRQYMKDCQVKTTHFFADYPDGTVQQVLRSLDVQRNFIDFALRGQEMDADQLKEHFYDFVDQIDAAETPKPGSI